MKIQQSVCFPMMQPLPVPIAEFIERVSRIGYAAVEIWKPDEILFALAELTEKHGLRIASMSGHDGIASGMNDPSQHERICEELTRSIDLAARFNIPGLICFSGNIRDGQTSEEAIEACVQCFQKIAPYAEQMGINLNMELLNTHMDHPGYQCSRSEWGLAVVKGVNSPRVKLLYDIYHMQIMEGNLIHTITRNIDWIGHFHTAGVPGRHQLDDSQEINYAGICSAIASTNYDLFVGHEFHPNRELFGTLEEAFELCNKG
jgi:hydroxypyruvate isomerase